MTNRLVPGVARFSALPSVAAPSGGGIVLRTFPQKRERGPAAIEILLLDALMGAVIASHYVYVLIFNLISNDLRLGIAGALLLIQTSLLVWALAARPAVWSLLVAAALAVKIGCWATSILGGFGPELSQAELLRLTSREVVPYMAAIWLLTWPERLPFRFVAVVGTVAFVIAAVWAVAGEPITLVGSRRLAGFTGGENELGLHGSAYFIILSFFIADRLRATGRLPAIVAWPLMSAALVLIAGYEVRTTITMLVAYVAGCFWTARLKHLLSQFGFGLAAALLIATAAYLAFIGNPGNIDAWGSGRLGSYAFRIGMLSERDLLPLLVGTGPGSDVVVTPIWWWEAHDSHSDLFTALVETGILGFLGVMLFFASLGMRLGPENRPLLYGLVASSAISNGLLVRPTEFFLLVLAMAAAERWTVAASPVSPVTASLPPIRLKAVAPAAGEEWRRSLRRLQRNTPYAKSDAR